MTINIRDTELIFRKKVVAAIDAIPEPSAGTVITFFQVQDDGTTGQLTTDSAADIAGIWDTPSLTDDDFTWNGTTGELTINADGTLDITAVVQAWNNLNNRCEIHLQLMLDTGSGYAKIAENSNYASRDNTQDEGGAMIPNFMLTVSDGDKLKLRVFDIGVAATAGSSNVANQTYISARLYK